MVEWYKSNAKDWKGIEICQVERSRDLNLGLD